MWCLHSSALPLARQTNAQLLCCLLSSIFLWHFLISTLISSWIYCLPFHDSFGMEKKTSSNILNIFSLMSFSKRPYRCLILLGFQNYCLHLLNMMGFCIAIPAFQLCSIVVFLCVVVSFIDRKKMCSIGSKQTAFLGKHFFVLIFFVCFFESQRRPHLMSICLLQSSGLQGWAEPIWCC